jgi:hypothetical protein
MRTDCIVKLSKLQISELNTLVQKETSDQVEGKPHPSDTRSNECLLFCASPQLTLLLS